MEQGKDSSTLVLYVIAALLLVVGAAWLLLSLRDAPPPPELPPAPVALDIPEQIDPQFELQQNLDMAEMALSAGQLVQPADGSALYFFLSALTQDPGNREAREGLAQIAAQMTERARTQLAGEEYAALGDSLRVLARIDASDPALIELRTELDAIVTANLETLDTALRLGQWEPAQALIDQLATVPGVDTEVLAQRQIALETAQEAAVNAASAEPASPPPRSAAAPATAPRPAPAQAERSDADFGAELGQRAAASLAAGRLLLPADDSAAFYLRELQRVAPDDPALLGGINDLIGALTQRALSSARAGRFDEAQSLLDAAGSFGVPSERVTAAAAQIAADRIAAEGRRVIPAGDMVNTRVVRPRYPIRALRNNTEGYVLLNFTVLTDGTTDNIEIVESSERYADQFRRAAEAAVAQWEFEPREFRGQVIEQRVQARVAFDIDQ